MSTKNKTAATVRSKSVAMLNNRLAMAIDLYLQVRQAHWNVKGKNFLSIHTLLGDIYRHLDDQADTIAERISQLGGQAVGVIDLIKGKTGVSGELDPNTTDSSAIVEFISNRLALYSAALLDDFNKATELGDHGTANLLIDFCNTVDKDVWMLESHLQ